MGFLANEVVPSGTISPITPPGKHPQHKVIQVTRTESGAQVKALLPAQSSVLYVTVHGSVASDATTSASVAVNLIQGGVTISTGSVDVKTNGTVTAIVQMTNLPNIQPIPAVGDIIVSTTKSTSGAETVGGPWKFSIEYVS